MKSALPRQALQCLCIFVLGFNPVFGVTAIAHADPTKTPLADAAGSDFFSRGSAVGENNEESDLSAAVADEPEQDPPDLGLERPLAVSSPPPKKPLNPTADEAAASEPSSEAVGRELGSVGARPMSKDGAAVAAPSAAAGVEKGGEKVLTKEEREFKERRLRWIIRHCNRIPDDPQCQFYLKKQMFALMRQLQRGDKQANANNVDEYCALNKQDKECQSRENKAEQEYYRKKMAEIRTYCKQNPTVPRCEEYLFPEDREKSKSDKLIFGPEQFDDSPLFTPGAIEEDEHFFGGEEYQ